MLPRRAAAPALLLVPFLAAQAPQHLVAPQAFAATDAPSYLWLATEGLALRLQTLVGPSHLQPLVGKELVALELRRSAADETFLGCGIQLQVRLAHSPRTPLSVSRAPADNLGPGAVLAFAGTVALPTSPPAPGPAVAWSNENVVRVPLAGGPAAPFVYNGGTLCVELVSQALPGQGVTWWMADAVAEDLMGSATSIGPGCGRYGGTASHCAERTLIPGAFAQFRAHGTPGGLGLLAFGVPGLPTPLGPYGLQAGCYLHLDPASAFVAAIDVFVPDAHPLLQVFGGTAEACVKIPAAGYVVGAPLTAQWLDVGQRTVGNAIAATIGGAVPTLDMACVEAAVGEALGSVRVDLAHVLRFEYRDPQ